MIIMEDYKLKYETLAATVKQMLEAQQDYFKSRNAEPSARKQLLMKSKSIEARVKQMVDPKPERISQATMDFLAK